MSDVPGPEQTPQPAPPGCKQRGPYVVRCLPGKHAYCRCTKSARYPLCDGSHRGTDITPIKIVLEEPMTVAWCACGASRNLPFCDGTHTRLP